MMEHEVGDIILYVSKKPGIKVFLSRLFSLQIYDSQGIIICNKDLVLKDNKLVLSDIFNIHDISMAWRIRNTGNPALRKYVLEQYALVSELIVNNAASKEIIISAMLSRILRYILSSRDIMAALISQEVCPSELAFYCSTYDDILEQIHV